MNKIWILLTSEENHRGISSVVGIATLFLLALGLILVRDVNLNLEKINDLTVKGEALFQGSVIVDNPNTKGQAAITELGDGKFLTSYGCMSFKVPNSYNWVHLSADQNSNMQWLPGKCE